MNTQPISRRTLLRGLGTVIALPWLESMGTLKTWAASTQGDRVAPNRMAFLYVPNGVDLPNWKPAQPGPLGDLPPLLRALDPVKKHLLVLSGLTADKARAHGDGGGDHARAMAAFLTGTRPRKTDGTDIRAGTSVDQLAALQIGNRTRLPSLELGAEPSAAAGNCDSGYACVYTSSLAWKSPTQPLPKETNPRLVFDRLFGSANREERARRDASRKSVLDFVAEDARDLTRRLGTGDRRKLDEYFTAVRELEQRIERAAALPPVTLPPGTKRPAAQPADFGDHLRLLCDLLVMAFQTDVTRVCTFSFANEASNRAYTEIGVHEGHHELSHHGRDPEKIRKIGLINRFHLGHYAYLLQRLRDIPEGEATLLDHCMIAYGSGNSDGDRHNHDDLPILLAGGGGGTLQGGRHLSLPAETPLTNLWASLLDRMEVSVPFIGDSTGKLPGLAGA